MGLLNLIRKRDSSSRDEGSDTGKGADTVSANAPAETMHTEENVRPSAESLKQFTEESVEETPAEGPAEEEKIIVTKPVAAVEGVKSIETTEEIPAAKEEPEIVPAEDPEPEIAPLKEEGAVTVPVDETVPKTIPAKETVSETNAAAPLNIDMTAENDSTFTSSISAFLGVESVEGIRSAENIKEPIEPEEDQIPEDFDEGTDEPAEESTCDKVTMSVDVPCSGDDRKVGVIYGNVGTSSFDCNVCAHLERSEYVMVNHEDYGYVLCQVGALIRKSNLSLEKSLRMSANTVIEDVVTAHIDVIGYRDQRGLLLMPRTTFMAGSDVLRADEGLVKNILGLKNNPKVGGYIGVLHGHDIPVFLDINELLQRHVCILAKTGGGKSYMSGDIIEELMKHDVTSMIIDPHGEYGAMRDIGKPGDSKFGVTPAGYADKIKEFAVSNETDDPNIRPLRFTFRTLEPREIVELMRANDMRLFLPPMKKAVEALREHQDFYSVQDLIDTINADPENRNPLLVTELEYINEMGVFSTRGNPITELVEKGKTTIINLKGVPPDIQQMIVKRLSTVMFELRKKESVPPMMMVIEEAHNYCPQAGTVISSKPLSTIASEGRKFGLGLMVISQRPAKIDKNVLSQCGTQIILKVTNPNDVKAISQSIEGLTNGMTDEIMTLPIGMALVVGAGIESPLLVEVRPRESRHGGGGVKVLEE